MDVPQNIIQPSHFWVCVSRDRKSSLEEIPTLGRSVELGGCSHALQEHSGRELWPQGGDGMKREVGRKFQADQVHHLWRGREGMCCFILVSSKCHLFSSPCLCVFPERLESDGKGPPSSHALCFP